MGRYKDVNDVVDKKEENKKIRNKMNMTNEEYGKVDTKYFRIIKLD